MRCRLLIEVAGKSGFLYAAELQMQGETKKELEEKIEDLVENNVEVMSKEFFV